MKSLKQHPFPNLCVVLAASTGGPSALVEVLQKIPDIQKSCVMIVQHLDEKLSSNLAPWLSEQTGLNVLQPLCKYHPKQGEIALLIGSHWQMNAAQQLEICKEPKTKVYFVPSIDLFMHSMVKHCKFEAIGVLLTGMGKDGAQGLLAMRQKGWKTYAQCEEGCMLYGMPKEAARIKAACVIQNPQHIGIDLYQSMQYNALSYKKENMYV